MEKKATDSTKVIYRYEPKKVATKIAAIYILAGALWILLSDKIVSLLIDEKEVFEFMSMLKGWGYVAVTGFVIYTLIYSALKRIKDATFEIACTNERLTESQQLLRNQYEEMIHNQEKLMKSEARYRLISEATNDAIWEEKNNKTLFSNRWYEITGYSEEDLERLGDWEVLIHPEDREIAMSIMENHKKNKTPYYQCEYRIKTKNGEYKWIQSRGKALFDEKGNIYCMVGSHTDISKIKDYEKELQYLAYHDQLTGLQNRAALNERLSELMKEKDSKKRALLFIDIDNFKFVNDTMGYMFGDFVLKQVAKRLQQFQNKATSIYRLCGDEFIILIEQFDKMHEVEKMAVGILKEFKRAVEIGDNSIFNTASIGIAVFPGHGSTLNELLNNAEIAMRKAKEAGKDNIVFYNEPMNVAVLERMNIERNLRRALQNNEFELYYQPQWDIKTSKISGFEALIRWKSPELGFVSPAKFISIAEDTHLILPIGEWVIRNASLFLKRLHQGGYTDLTMSVNVSILQILKDDFVDMVTDILELTKLNPKYMELEITESILMESYEVIAGKLKLLRARGVGIALDDFGKGYSSLNYLRHLPITTLKIDKAFIDTISTEGNIKSLTDLIIKIGRSMDLCVVAEGVETQEQMDYLIRHKCNKIQGYLFSKPLPEQEAVQKLREGWII